MCRFLAECCLWILPPQVPSSVTCIDFCTEHPFLLAAGTHDGSVLIFDIREPGDKPALESTYATGKVPISVACAAFVACVACVVVVVLVTRRLRVFACVCMHARALRIYTYMCACVFGSFVIF
jgi:hypothetical protein